MDGSSEKPDPLTNLTGESLEFDQRIYPLLMQGNSEAWYEFYDHYRDRLCFYFGRNSIKEDDREDLLQQTVEVIFKRLAHYDPERASFRSWIYGIANVLQRQHKRKQLGLLNNEEAGEGALSQAALKAEDPFVEKDENVNPRLSQLAMAITNLSEKDQQILKLRASRPEATWGDLSQELNIGTSAAKMRHQRALLKLEEAMKALALSLET